MYCVTRTITKTGSRSKETEAEEKKGPGWNRKGLAGTLYKGWDPQVPPKITQENLNFFYEGNVINKKVVWIRLDFRRTTQ